jgi:hypothetical protein
MRQKVRKTPDFIVKSGVFIPKYAQKVHAVQLDKQAFVRLFPMPHIIL